MEKDPLILPTVSIETKALGFIETPVVTVTIDPVAPNVGDNVSVRANVKRADDITAIEGIKVDFFAIDSLGPSILGDRQETDASGDAIAPQDYWVGKPEAGQDIKFVVVTRPKVIP